jgi:small subunit ribosomal protein S9
MVEIKQKKRKSKKHGITSKAKKKEAAARAVIRAGKGRITVNNRSLKVISPKYIHDLINEPLVVAGPRAHEVDIQINVHGGGFMGQAISARAAIAKALVEYFNDEKLRKAFLAYDRLMLVDDVRRVEPKKQLGPKARTKKQRSKR